MRIKKFQNPTGPLLRNYVAQNDVTYIPQPRIIQKYKLPGYITLTDGTKIKPDNTVTEVSSQSNILPQQQAYYNAVGKEKDKKEKQRQQVEEAKRITLGVLDAIATLPSRTIGAVKDTKSRNKSFVSSMIEGNEGLGNEELNTLINFIGPAAFTKGLRIFPKGVQTVARFAASPYTGKWTQIGNRAYRLKPGYAGMNNIWIERRALITPEDLRQRKFFPVEEYGPEPIYTRETVPKDIKVRQAVDDVNPTIEDDITYMNENFDEKTMSTMQVARNRLKLWKESPHGRAINFGGDTDLSTDSWPQTLIFNMNRHLEGTGTAYIPNNYGTIESFLNNAGSRPISQETVDYFNQLIKEFNEKTKLGLSYARFVPKKYRFYLDGKPIIIKSTGQQAFTPARIYTPNLGLIKHKNGAKIVSHN